MEAENRGEVCSGKPDVRLAQLALSAWVKPGERSSLVDPLDDRLITTFFAWPSMSGAQGWCLPK